MQGLDRYAYTGNNPINYNDPSGHEACALSSNACNGNHNSPSQNNPSLVPPTQGEEENNKVEESSPSKTKDVKITFPIANQDELYSIHGKIYKTYCINAVHCSSLTWYVIFDYQEQLNNLIVNDSLKPYTGNDFAKDIFLHYLEYSPAGIAIGEMSFWAETGSQSSKNQIKAAYSAILNSISHSPIESGQPIVIELYENLNNSNGQGAGALSAYGYGERYNVELGGWAGGGASATIRSILDSLPIPSYP